ARLLIVTEPRPVIVPLKLQLVVPVAFDQVAPPLSDTCTPETMPPPASAAVPLTVIADPDRKLAPAAGDVIVDVGGAVSVEAAAATRPPCSVAGWTPISAKRLIVACCIRTSAAVPERS